MTIHNIPIVHVQWIDSMSLGEWRDLSDVDHAVQMIDTVGLLVHQDKDVYFIASTYDGEREAINAAIWIPRACIKNVKTLGHIKVRCTD